MKLTQIKYHGILGEQLKKSNFKLAVKSVSEAIHATNTLLKGQLYKQLLENDTKNIKYEVLINGRQFLTEKPLDARDPESIRNSELMMSQKNLETIDVVPVLEGGDQNILAIVLGVVLVIVGIVLLVTGVGAPFGVALVLGGLGIIAAGVINLLSSPPKVEDFREIGGGGKPSYLFSGPQNVVGVGGPVPVFYGQGIIGSQTIMATYEVSHQDATERLTV